MKTIKINNKTIQSKMFISQERRPHHVGVRVHRLQTDRPSSRSDSPNSLSDRHLPHRTRPVDLLNRLAPAAVRDLGHRARSGSTSARLLSVRHRRFEDLHFHGSRFGHCIVSRRSQRFLNILISNYYLKLLMTRFYFLKIVFNK